MSSPPDRTTKYAWVERVLAEECYASMGRKQRGAVRTRLSTAAGFSMPQITRLIRQYRQSGHIRVQLGTRRRFPFKYTAEDVNLLVEVDGAHEHLSGPATRRILQREYQVFGKQEFARLAQISVAHLYNLRHSIEYCRANFEAPVAAPPGIPIAARGRPEPRGTPGQLRVDAVYRIDGHGRQGCSLTAVDAATQWEVISYAAGITEEAILSALETLLHQFPFRVVRFHVDHGSDVRSGTLTKLLNQAVDGPGGAGADSSAGEVQRFYTAHLNPYLNFHRPCGFAQIRQDERGRRWRHYGKEDYLTPYEKLRSLPEAHLYLKNGIRWDALDHAAYRYSDTEAASRVLRARTALSCADGIAGLGSSGLSYFSGSSYVPSRRIQMFR